MASVHNRLSQNPITDLASSTFGNGRVTAVPGSQPQSGFRDLESQCQEILRHAQVSQVAEDEEEFPSGIRGVLGAGEGSWKCWAERAA